MSKIRNPALGAWFGDEELKAEVVAKVKLHRERDEIIQGDYQIRFPGTESGFKGCALGCTLPYISRLAEGIGTVDDALAWSMLVEAYYNIDADVASTIDHLFESINDFDEAAKFAVEVIEAIPAGADLKGVAGLAVGLNCSELIELLKAAPLVQTRAEEEKTGAVVFMMSPPRFTVIIPTYNRAHCIGHAIASVLGQSYRNFELLVIDDGSTDDTVPLLAAIQDSRLRVMAQENAGVSAARNRGLSEAQGELIAYLDSDNVWHRGFLDCVAQELSPGYVAAYTGQNLMLIDKAADGELQIVGRRTRNEPYNPVVFQKKNYIDIGCFVHRREIVDEVGGFNANVPWAEDWDFIGRIAVAHPFGILHIDQVLSDYCVYLPSVHATQTNQDADWSRTARASFMGEHPPGRDRDVADSIEALVRHQHVRWHIRP